MSAAQSKSSSAPTGRPTLVAATLRSGRQARRPSNGGCSNEMRIRGDNDMTKRFIIRAIIAAALACVAVVASPALHADPAHPTAREVNTMVDMLRFRSGMLADAPKAVSTYAVGAARRQ